MQALAELISLVLDALFGRSLTPTEETPSAHPVDAPPVGSPAPGEAPPKKPATIPFRERYGAVAPIVAAMKRKGYSVFENDERNFNLNIVGIRNPSAKLDKFDCRLVVFWKYEGEWVSFEWKVTTFPGSRYLIERLLNVRGSAILVPGQYLGVYKLDLHGGRYRALCQRNGAVNVYRDGNRDRVFDLDPKKVHNGWFGINIHAPKNPSGAKSYIAERVYAASAGCQVFQRVRDFLEFSALCEKAAAVFGNQFTYTLLTEDDLLAADAEPPEEVDPKPLTITSVSPSAKWEPDFDTTGVRNKNLLNVKGEDWLYSLGRDARGHNKFPTFEKGLRAGIITLRSYWTRHKKRSIASILSRWAPATDTIGSLPGNQPNSPAAYSAFVSKRVGAHTHAPLRIFDDAGEVVDPDQLYRLVAAMAAYENNAALKLPREVFDGALALV